MLRFFCPEFARYRNTGIGLRKGIDSSGTGRRQRVHIGHRSEMDLKRLVLRKDSTIWIAFEKFTSHFPVCVYDV